VDSNKKGASYLPCLQ